MKPFKVFVMRIEKEDPSLSLFFCWWKIEYKWV